MLGEPAVVGDREDSVVEAEPAGAGGQHASDGLDQLAGENLAPERRGHLLGRLGPVSEVGQEHMRAALARALAARIGRGPRAVGVARGREDDCGAVGTGEVRHVAQVVGRVHEQRVQLALAQLGHQALQARRQLRRRRAHAPPRASRSPISARASA